MAATASMRNHPVIWILFLIVAVGWFSLAPKPTLVDVTVVADGQTSCGGGRIFSDPWPEPKTPAFQYHQSYFLSNNEIVVKTQVPAPASFFRFDYCDRQGGGHIAIRHITLTYEEKTVTLLPEQLVQWRCENCSASLVENQVLLQSDKGTPMLINSRFGEVIDQLQPTYQQQRPTIRKLLGLVLLVLTGTLLSVHLTRKQLIALLPTASGVLVMALLWVLAYANYNRFLSWFAAPSVQEGIGYVQYQAFPVRAEYVLYLLPLVITFVLFGVLAVFRKRA